MDKPSPLDKDEIRAIVAAEKASAIGSDGNSDLGKQRSDALDYYQSDLTVLMPTMEGQSKAASSDVSDVIETMMPTLMDIFTSGDDYCLFSPEGPEDEEAAQQETDYVNHVFMQENDGFLILYSMIKDALLSKNGVVKAWWEKSEKVEKETYRGLDEEAYSAIVDDEEAEIIEQTPNDDGTYDVKARKSYTKGCLKAMPVPPEEFGIAKRAKDVPTSPYCYHKFQRSVSDLIEDGYDREEVENLPSATSVSSDAESYARDTVTDESGSANTVNRAMRLIDVTEHYVRLDADGDGVAELLKVVTAGSGEVMLGDPEEFDRMPFHSITPYPMPHRFFGRSVADLTIDIMRIKTHLIRALLDNAALLNNQRIAVGSDGADDNTLDDLLTNRPGGLVRMKNVEQLKPIPNTQLGGHLLPLIEYVDQTRETRTGVTRNAGGIDPDVLNKAAATATGFQGLLDQSMMRIKLIARIFAETGIKSLFLHIHELNRKHQDKAKMVRLRNKWVKVDPRAWRGRSDMTVDVALGTGSKQQQLVMLNAILERQVQAIEMQGGPGGPLVELTHVWTTLKRMVELVGFKDTSLFFAEPDPDYEPEPQQDPKVVEIQGRQQLEQQKLQLQGQSDQARLALDGQKAEAEMMMRREEADLKLQLAREDAMLRAQLARDKALEEAAQNRERMMMEFDLEREKMALQAANDERQRQQDAELSENRPGGDLSK